MGWLSDAWGSFTDALGFTNHSQEAASHEYADQLRAAGAASAEEIAKGRVALQEYYDRALEKLMQSYGASSGMIKAGTQEANQLIGDTTGKAAGTIADYLGKGRQIAESYYNPYRRALDVMTGVVQGSPAETQRLVQGSPLYQWQQQQAQKSLDRAMRAKGLGSSRFGMKAQADLTAELAAKEQDRRIGQLMDLYRQGGALGTSMGQAYTGAGGKIAELQSGGGMQQAQNTMTGGANAANLGFDYGKLYSGALQDLGSSIAASHGAIGTAMSNAYSAAAQAEAAANAGGGNPLDNLLKIYQAGSGTWW